MENQENEGQVLPADVKPLTVDEAAVTSVNPPTPSVAAKAAPPPPLATGDARFMTLRRATMKQLRAKVIKLFNKTSDRAVRFFPDEMAVHMACMAFEEVFSMKRILQANHPPHVVQQHDPVQIFIQAFGALVRQMSETEDVERKKVEVARDGASVPQGSPGSVEPPNPGSSEVGPAAVENSGGAVRGDGVDHSQDGQAVGDQAPDQPVPADAAGTAPTPT